MSSATRASCGRGTRHLGDRPTDRQGDRDHARPRLLPRGRRRPLAAWPTPNCSLTNAPPPDAFTAPRPGLVCRPGITTRRVMTNGAWTYTHNTGMRELLAERDTATSSPRPTPRAGTAKSSACTRRWEREWARGLRYRNSTARNRAATLAAVLQPAQTPQLTRRPPTDQPRSQPLRAGQLGRTARDRDARLVGEDHGLHAVAQPELHQHVGDVGLDGRLADDRSAAISALDSPRATSEHLDSRAVSPSKPGAGAGGRGRRANSSIRRRVIDGASSASPRATTRMRRRAARAGRP